MLNFEDTEPVVLRDYQQQAVDDVRARMRRRLRRLMLCAPTGAGKTVIACHVAESVVKKHKRCMFIADRITLVDQALQEFHRAGIHVGRIQGDTETDFSAPVQVASSQTLERRIAADEPLIHGPWGSIDDYDLVVVDEAHAKRQAICDLLVGHDVRAIGLSATPLTAGLADTWQDLIMVRTTRALIKDGWLMEPLVYSCPEPDEGRLETGSNGEWTADSVFNTQRGLIGDIVTTWELRTKEHFGGPVPTLVFSSTIDHGAELVRAFQAAGYDFQQTSYLARDADETAAKVRDFKAGQITGLVSVDKLVKGFDAPTATCMVIARQLRRGLALHIQMLGRIMRPSEGKPRPLVLDHAGNCAGFQAAVEQFWTRGIDKLPDDAVRPVRESKRERKDRICAQCSALLIPGQSVCPQCGHERPRRQTVQHRPGELTELQKRDPYADLNQMAKDRYPMASIDPAALKKATAWLRVNYKNLTGRWTKRGCDPKAPDIAVDEGIRAAVRRNFQRWLIAKKASERKAS